MKVSCPHCKFVFEPTIPLSPRAKEMLQYLIEGYSNKEIAVEMNVEERTIKSYISSALRHFNVKNRVALAVVYVCDQHKINSQKNS